MISLNWIRSLCLTPYREEDIIEELKEIEISTLTPIDALNTLYRLQNKLKNRW